MGDLISFDYEKMKMIVGNNIKRCREISGLSQAELGNRVGVGQQQISRYECGLSVPPLDMLYLLSRVLGVFVEDFLHNGHKHLRYAYPVDDTELLKKDLNSDNPLIAKFCKICLETGHTSHSVLLREHEAAVFEMLRKKNPGLSVEDFGEICGLLEFSRQRQLQF